MYSPRALINLKNLKDNINYLKQLSQDSILYPVIKANAYGHGLIEIGSFLSKNNINCVCVATYEEIKELIDANIKIDFLHLGKICYDNLDLYFNKNVIATINSVEDVEKIISATKKYDRVIRCHVKIDTGLNRMGCKESDFKYICESILKNRNLLELEGVYSHLSSSTDPDSSSNFDQFKKFERAIHSISSYQKINFHILNSGGLFNYKQYRFDIIRPGISIYGVSPIGVNNNLKPVMELKAPVILLKNVLKGETVGYDCTYVAERDMNIAILQCGYADGLNKNFEKDSFVFYNGLKFPIIGKVSMDLFAIDCKDFNFKINNEVTIWGGDSKESRLEEISSSHGQIPYVYLTNLSNRVKRVYIEE